MKLLFKPVCFVRVMCGMSRKCHPLFLLCLFAMLTGCGAGSVDELLPDTDSKNNLAGEAVLTASTDSSTELGVPAVGAANSAVDLSAALPVTDTMDVTGENITAEEAAEIQAAINLAAQGPQPDAPQISDVVISLVTEDSAQITWSLDQPSTGVIEYGQTTAFDLASPPETSFKYSAHRQTLRNLAPGTEYFLRIISANEFGGETSSEVFSFTTVSGEAVDPVTPAQNQAQTDNTQTPTANSGSTSAGWPDVYDDSLPLAGLFYGNYKAGLMSGNAPLAAQNAIRFRAERTGMVNAMRYNNRRILPTDINHRCDLYGEGSYWCECKDNGLDSWSCGYTLPNAYHVGSGGLITVELRTDDGTSNHLPSSTVLAETEAYRPAAMPAKFPTLEFVNPVQVQAGQIYHIVFRNDKPPTCDMRNLTVEEAAACPRDEGAIGMNGTKHSGDESEGSRFGPVIGDISGRVLFKPKNNLPWRVSQDVITFYELRYTDNEYVGNSYTGFDNRMYTEEKGGSQVIEGNIIARQAFTVEDATREVDGLWLNYGHAYDRPANGSDLAVTLKDADGQVLATTTLPASMACSIRAQAGAGDKPVRATRDEWMCRKWGYAELSQATSLLEGSTYSVEFSAPQGAAYALSSYFSVHRLPERNIWDNARAEISRNGGSTWKPWTGNFFATRDLPVVFTIVGMPRQLP